MATTGQVAAPASPVVVVIVTPNPMPLPGGSVWVFWLSRAERGSFQPRTLGSVLGHTRGHGPQRFGRVNVHQGCVGTTRTELEK